MIALLIGLFEPEQPMVPLLEPPSYSLREGQQLSARLLSQAGSVSWAFVRAGGWQANLADLPARLPIDTPDWTVAMIGCDLRPEPPTWEQVALIGTVTRIESSALTLIRRQGTVGGSPVAVSEAGLRCELQPMIDPTSTAGGQTAIKLKFDGKPTPKVRVYVQVDDLKALEFETSPSGTVNIPHDPGRYRVWALWAETTPEGKVGRSASLTYEVRP